MISDYHCHTTASDGTLSPPELIDRAISVGVEELAITDHDTLAAYRQLSPAAENIKLIPGIELSCQWQNRGIHIVGLNVSPDTPAMAEAEAFQSAARQQRAIVIGEKLEKYGVSSPLEGALAYADGGSIGRPHFARHMVASGFASNVNQAFKKFLGNGKPCDIKIHWPDPAQVIEWIRGAGGVAVLAHPGKYNMTRTKLLELVSDFVSLGGQGLEVVSGRQLPNETRDYNDICERKNLLASWGSDFHSPGQVWLDIGKYSTVPAHLTPVWSRWR